MGVPHYWTTEQIGRLLDTLAANHRHPARTLALIMWRTGLRISEALDLEWRDLDYRGDPPTLIVRQSKSGRARTVPLHGELVALFTNWPTPHRSRDRASSHWRRHPVGGPRRGVARYGQTSGRHPQPAALGRSALAYGGPGAAQHGFTMAGPRQRPGDVEDLPAHRGQHLLHVRRAVIFRGKTVGAPARLCVEFNLVVFQPKITGFAR